MRVCFAALLFAAIIVAASAPAARAMDDDASADLPENAASPQPLTVADREDAAAQYHIGFMYERGQGAPQDYEEARRWYLKAAAHDDPFAEFSLGVLSAHGYGRRRTLSRLNDGFAGRRSAALPRPSSISA